ncbi:MAG TPA: hypothetical protein VI094_19370 [Propionibacteriaceae bacterium]
MSSLRGTERGKAVNWAEKIVPRETWQRGRTQSCFQEADRFNRFVIDTMLAKTRQTATDSGDSTMDCRHQNGWGS